MQILRGRTIIYPEPTINYGVAIPPGGRPTLYIWCMSIVMEARARFHKEICRRLYGRRPDSGNYSNADGSSEVSKAFAMALGDELVNAGLTPTPSPVEQPQTVGAEFARITAGFLKDCYEKGFARLRPAAKWDFKPEAMLADYFQYAHLSDLEKLSDEYRGEANYWMAAVVGGDYHIKHDVLMFRRPESIDELNDRAGTTLLDPGDEACKFTPLLSSNQREPILHAAVSTKWTLRSDRAQNVRTEALNLQKHRKGRTPHLVAITAEPQPSRLESLALGTGEIDCVYHVALPEFITAATRSAAESGLHWNTVRARKDQLQTLKVLEAGRQLRDIADLPFDLAM